MIRIGIDIGGTFTDFAAWRQGEAEIFTFKTSTTAPDYARGFKEGFAEILGRIAPVPREPIVVMHGTTITTNTVIERKGAEIALLVTKGYRDLLELERLKLRDSINILASRPLPLVPRDRVFEIDERMDAGGTVVAPLDPEEVCAAARAAIAAGATGIVVAFLHSYRNARHETLARDAIVREMPQLDVSISSEIWPRVGEYERALIGILNAYVKPRVNHYLGEIEDFLNRDEFNADLFVTRSNGGVMAVREARHYPVHTLLSGPASGVTAAQHLGNSHGTKRFLTMDMGGTSTDLSLIVDGRTTVTNDAEVGDFPLALTVTGIEAIGAGGGSIAWMDRKVLQIGPESAGATPGPACFGRGGKRPTVTDAYLLCGYIDPDNFLGGRMVLDKPAAEQAIASIADALGLDAAAAAEACITVATSNMVASVLPYLARHGVDPEELTLVVFGGAGSLHGPLLAREIGINRILVPRNPSVFCAYGGLVSDLIQDEVASVHGESITTDMITTTLVGLQNRAEGWLAAQIDPSLLNAVRVEYWAEMRYRGQSFELAVMLPEGSATHHPNNLARIHDVFHLEHERLFSHADRGAPVEITELRVRIFGSLASPEPVTFAPDEGELEAARTGHRRLRLDAREFPDVPVYERDLLPTGCRLAGPVVIEQNDTAILVPLDFQAEVLPTHDILISKGA